jgi:NAD(P)-dependent dehydrogenase (short-subunit alcohol dehydrogenase family)
MVNQKKIVVVGGTSGIGLAAVQAFLDAGAGVIAVGFDENSCAEARDILGSKNIDVICGDARQENTAKEAIALCIKKYKTFDGLFHVAGGSGRKHGDGPIHQMTEEGWQYTLDLNLKSLMWSNKAAINAFLALKKGGSILNLSSVLSFSPSPNYFTTHAYAAAKAATLGLSKSLAAHYAKDNIRINVVAPGLIKSPMSARAAENEDIMHFVKTKQPLDGGRIGLPEDLTGAAVFFMSDASSFTTGQTMYISGGWEISDGQY